MYNLIRSWKQPQNAAHVELSAWHVLSFMYLTYTLGRPYAKAITNHFAIVNNSMAGDVNIMMDHTDLHLTCTKQICTLYPRDRGNILLLMVSLFCLWCLWQTCMNGKHSPLSSTRHCMWEQLHNTWSDLTLMRTSWNQTRAIAKM
jgi:hypothetical protein